MVLTMQAAATEMKTQSAYLNTTARTAI
jgi:hypothetical protein